MLKNFLSKFLFLSFFISLFFLNFNLKTFAQEKSFNISSYNIIVNVNEDGSADVQEKIIYDFTGNFHNAFLYKGKLFDSKLNKRDEEYEYSDFKVFDENKEYKKIETEDKDAPLNIGEYIVIDEGDRVYIKWHFDEQDVKKTFVINYKIKNLVTLHKDCADIYYQFISKGWNVPINNIVITVNLPKQSKENKKALTAFIHPLLNNAKWQINDEATSITFTIPKVVNNYVEIHILSDKNIFTYGVSGSSDIETLLREEGAVKKMQFFEKILLLSSFYILNISIFVCFVLSVLFFKKAKKKKTEVFKGLSVNQAERLWDPPSNEDPYIVSLLKQKIIPQNRSSIYIDPKGFASSITYLVFKKIYKFVKKSYKVLFIKDEKYGIKPTGKKDYKLPPVVFAINLVLNKIKKDKNKVLWFDSLSKYFNDYDHAKDLSDKLKKLTSDIFKSKKYIQINTLEPSKIRLIITFIVNPIFFFYIFGLLEKYNFYHFYFDYIVLFDITFIVFAFVYAVLGFMNLDKYIFTKKGAMEVLKWQAYKDHLEEYYITKDYPIDSIILWEKVLIYGIALGVSKKALSNLPVSFNLTKEDLEYFGLDQASGVAEIVSSISEINKNIESISMPSPPSKTSFSSTVSSFSISSGSGASGGSSRGGGGGGGSNGGGGAY